MFSQYRISDGFRSKSDRGLLYAFMNAIKNCPVNPQTFYVSPILASAVNSLFAASMREHLKETTTVMNVTIEKLFGIDVVVMKELPDNIIMTEFGVQKLKDLMDKKTGDGIAVLAEVF